MIQAGLTSITFRNRSADQVLQLATSSGLAGIEWSGNCHLTPGDVAEADNIGRQTREAGLTVVSFGSYYRCGVTPEEEFCQNLETALALGAPSIRVWAGEKGPDEADWQPILEDLARICSEAGNYGLTIALEFHRGTLTETAESTLELLKQVEATNLRTLWQPYVERRMEDSLKALNAILPKTEHVHVFHRDPECATTRLPLEEGTTDWTEYLKLIHRHKPCCYTLLEFVRDDSEDQFRKDVQIFKNLITKIETE